jgi:hypothetical protein
MRYYFLSKLEDILTKGSEWVFKSISEYTIHIFH